MTRAIKFYISKNVDNAKIRKYINEIYEEEYTQEEIDEAIEFVQAATKI